MYLAAKFQRFPVFVKFAQICSDIASGFYIHLKIKATVSRDFGLKTRKFRDFVPLNIFVTRVRAL